jgi:alanine racemase
MMLNFNGALLKKIEISSDALQNNIAVIRENLSPGTQLCCIVKSNAYGHGLENIIEVIEPYADAFGIVDLKEAAIIRKKGIRKKIINIGCTLPEFADTSVELQISPHIYTINTVKALAISALKQGKQIEVFVKLETGMNRCGVAGKELEEILQFISSSKELIFAGFVTHFAEADTADSEFTRLQIERFENLRKKYLTKYSIDDFSHTANTGATFMYPESHYNMVRVGLGIYGMSPSNCVYNAGAHRLTQVLEYKSKIIQIHKVKKNHSVSYSGIWTAPKDSVIAIIPIGYADGFSRALSNRGHVIINDQRAPVVGRVCMNNFAIDITHIKNVLLYTEVTIISRNKKFGITVDDIAKSLNTINYEVTTVIPERIPRLTI